MNKTVTIIVTVYNIKEYLDRFFQCLKDQTFGDYEALIIDDGSEDGSLEVCRRYAAEDDRIRLIELEHVGISDARAVALNNINTEFAASVDGDDYFDKDYLKHLTDAQKKYNADLVLSNVIYRDEDGKETARFEPRPEGFYEKERFAEILPHLLAEERLNYLYGKLFKTEFLKKVHIEQDVRQGSDTMINCRYIMEIGSLAVITDYDYNYVRYQSRSVTSYKGRDFYTRLLRVNRFLYEITEQNGYLSDDMYDAIDMRILQIGRQATYRIMFSDGSDKEKNSAVREITHSEEYMNAYSRQKEKDRLKELPFKVIEPDNEATFIANIKQTIEAANKEKRKEQFRERIPSFLLDLYRKLR